MINPEFQFFESWLGASWSWHSSFQEEIVFKLTRFILRPPTSTPYNLILMVNHNSLKRLLHDKPEFHVVESWLGASWLWQLRQFTPYFQRNEMKYILAPLKLLNSCVVTHAATFRIITQSELLLDDLAH